MRLLLCYLCPPAAVLLCGRPFSMVLNCILTMWFWLPGVRHALVVYADWKLEYGNKQLVSAVHAPRWASGFQQQPQVVYYEPPQLPTSRRKAKPEPAPLIDDPLTGARGTVFRRKS